MLKKTISWFINNTVSFLIGALFLSLIVAVVFAFGNALVWLARLVGNQIIPSKILDSDYLAPILFLISMGIVGFTQLGKKMRPDLRKLFRS